MDKWQKSLFKILAASFGLAVSLAIVDAVKPGGFWLSSTPFMESQSSFLSLCALFFVLGCCAWAAKTAIGRLLIMKKLLIISTMGAVLLASSVIAILLQNAKLYHEKPSSLITPEVIGWILFGCFVCFLPLFLGLIFRKPK